MTTVKKGGSSDPSKPPPPPPGDGAVGVLHTLARQRGVLLACTEHKQRRLACARNCLQPDSFTAIELSKRATHPPVKDEQARNTTNSLTRTMRPLHTPTRQRQAHFTILHTFLQARTCSMRERVASCEVCTHGQACKYTGSLCQSFT